MIDDRLKDARPIISVSGGKDSTAMCLHMFELGYTRDDFDRVFCDTGWEDQQTYDYLDELEETIGPITRLREEIQVKDEHKELVAHFEERLGFKSAFVRNCFKYTAFPSRYRKWCTTNLKLKPVTSYFKTLDYDYVNLVGIRREESLKRSTMAEWEWNESFDCWVWRPLIMWTEKDVIDIHHRFNLVPNRLYLNGAQRVGCYPCINSRKKEIKNLSAERVGIIRDLERILNDLRYQKEGIPQEKKDKWIPLTFFLPKVSGTPYIGIDAVMDWSRTSRGGMQFEMFATEEPTCVKWGMCEFK
jgi:3'-phosphoadenosine 5'-phosphosulfate sulfotransferase (PAPS reductase)/FAD synthetase